MLRRRTADDAPPAAWGQRDSVASLTAARAALARERAALSAERAAATAAAEAAADAAAALAVVVARCERAGVARRPDGEAALRELVCGQAPRRRRRRVGKAQAAAAVVEPVATATVLPPTRPASGVRRFFCLAAGGR